MFAGVSFALSPGDALILRGPNGAGKSSMLRLLAGFLEPAAGGLSWAGKLVSDDPAAHRARLHLIGHSNAIKRALTVRENLSFAAAVAGAPGTSIDRALENFDLRPLAEVPAMYLSAGQGRRLALARLYEARFVREDDRLHAVAEVEFRQDVRQVRLHRRFREEERGCDLGIR